MRRSSSSLALFVFGLVLTKPAFADESDDAIKRGIELRRARKDAEALEQFRLAQTLRPSARALAQAGLAEQALSQWAAAEQHLTEALAQREDAWISQNREVLEGALAAVASRLGTVEVTSNRADVELFVAGVRQGRLPQTFRAPAGVVALELRAPGRDPVARSVELTAQQTVRERIELPEEPPAPPAVSAPPAVLVPLAPPPRAALPVEEPSRTWAWVTLGGAVAFTAGGALLHVSREQAAARFNDDERCFFGDLTREERCGADLSRAESRATQAIIGYAAGAVLGGVSAYLWLSQPSGPRARVGVMTSPQATFLRLERQF